jgi:nicotinamide mononucleotide adenylyltransferase
MSFCDLPSGCARPEQDRVYRTRLRRQAQWSRNAVQQTMLGIDERVERPQEANVSNTLAKTRENERD